MGASMGIVWASWLSLTAFGWSAAFVVIYLGSAAVRHGGKTFMALAIAASSFVSGVLVLYGTKARHPGWVGLFAVTA
jgi:hypothetical protein